MFVQCQKSQREDRMVACCNREEHGPGLRGSGPAHSLLPRGATSLRVSPRPLLEMGLGHTACLAHGHRHQRNEGY